MSVTKPYGDPRTATIFVIGHDPRLQRSQAEAKYAFFFNYLECSRPTYGLYAAKYDLAYKVWEYIEYLAGSRVALDELYVTNLCNEFLPHVPASGTVLIPDEVADHGVGEVARAVAGGHFRLILSMAVQPFYHLCRTGFIDEKSDLVSSFVAGAQPRKAKAQQGLYEQAGKVPFLSVCGQMFHHSGVSVVPVVHVKQWPLRSRLVRYAEPMRRAKQNVEAALRGQ